MSVNSTIKVYYGLLNKYHNLLSKSDCLDMNKFYLERIRFYLDGITGIYSILIEPTQHDKNYLSAAEFMYKQAKEVYSA